MKSAADPSLAQLDFAGFWNVFDIDSGDSPQALHIIMGVGGVLTIAVLVLAFIGAALAAMGNSAHALCLSPPPSPSSSPQCRSGSPPASSSAQPPCCLVHPTGRPDPTSAQPA